MANGITRSGRSKKTSILFCHTPLLAARKVIPLAYSNKEGWEGVLLAQLIQDRLAGDTAFLRAVSGHGKRTDPAFLKTGDVVSELVRLGAFPPGFMEMTNDQAIDLFKKGKAAMLISRDRLFAALNFSTSSVKGKVDIARFPFFPDSPNGGAAGSAVLTSIWRSRAQASRRMRQSHLFKRTRVTTSRRILPRTSFFP